MQTKHLKFLLIIVFCFYQNAYAQTSFVKISGAMSNVMRKGQLHGTILLDTISNKTSLYGLGPLEYLKGELLIIDGKSYVSNVNNDGSIVIKESYNVQAPFFVYANNTKWKQHLLPNTIKTLQQFEKYIDELSKNHNRPFVFKLSGTYSKLNFHIQNLPNGTIVKSPNDAHQGQGKFERKNVTGDIVGFFSTIHQAIFTHHDTFIHLHYINSDRTEMGHVDDLLFSGKSRIILYLPEE